jgi:hypothetical protein
MFAVILLMTAAGIFISNSSLCGTNVAEEITSLDLVGQPLGEVLDEISGATGYRFILDENWENFLVSASIKNEPLHKVLKRILGKLNNVIIYNSNRTIQIIIFDVAATSRNRSSAFVDRISDDESLQRSIALPAESLPALPSANQELSDVEDDSRLSEDSDSTAAEPDETASGDEESAEDEAGEAVAEDNGEEGSEQNEKRPGPEKKNPDESTTDN